MFLMRADTLCWQVGGGWALEILSPLGILWIVYSNPKDLSHAHKCWFKPRTNTFKVLFSNFFRILERVIFYLFIHIPFCLFMFNILLRWLAGCRSAGLLQVSWGFCQFVLGGGPAKVWVYWRISGGTRKCQVLSKQKNLNVDSYNIGRIILYISCQSSLDYWKGSVHKVHIFLEYPQVGCAAHFRLKRK